jgi:hypothetical protein
MNIKTRRELNKLADVMIKNHNIEQIKGTSLFLSTAYMEAERNSIRLSNQSIRKYGEWLEIKCMSDSYELPNGLEWSDFDETDTSAEDEIILQAAAIIARRRAAQSKEDEDDNLFDIDDIFTQARKVYTIFDEKGDSVVVTRGAYSKPPFAGMTPKEINEMRGWPCMAGWADGLLTENEKLGRDRVGGLTGDDIEVLNKIKRNEI